MPFYHKEARPLRSLKPQEEILHFSLPGILPTAHVLALNTRLGTLSHLKLEEDRPHLLMEQQFSLGEMCTLVPLLESAPNYAPYEVLLASFAHGNTATGTVERCRRRLQEAYDAGVWDVEMRPLRNAISRMRIKLRAFDLDAISILETGYILVRRDPANAQSEERVSEERRADT